MKLPPTRSNRTPLPLRLLRGRFVGFGVLLLLIATAWASGALSFDWPVAAVLSTLALPPVVLALPLAILIALAIYVAALLQGIKALVCAALGKQPPQDLHRPHFLKQQAPPRKLPQKG